MRNSLRWVSVSCRQLQLSANTNARFLPFSKPCRPNDHMSLAGWFITSSGQFRQNSIYVFHCALLNFYRWSSELLQKNIYLPCPNFSINGGIHCSRPTDEEVGIELKMIFWNYGYEDCWYWDITRSNSLKNQHNNRYLTDILKCVYERTRVQTSSSFIF